MIALIGAAFELAGKLVSIGLEYATASAEKKAQLRAKAEADVGAYLKVAETLGDKIAANNAEADDAVAKKFGA